MLASSLTIWTVQDLHLQDVEEEEEDLVSASLS
jgi:hypothetical protein